MKYRIVETQYFDTLNPDKETDRYEVKSFEAKNIREAFNEFQRVYEKFLDRYPGFSVREQKRMSVDLRTSNNSRVIYSLIKVRK